MDRAGTTSGYTVEQACWCLRNGHDLTCESK